MALSAPVEDDFRDVLRKAAAGLGARDPELREVSGLDGLNYASLFSGPVIPPRNAAALEPALLRLAARLRLGGPQLLALARGAFRPPEEPGIEGLFACSTPFGAGLVNAALVWDPVSKKAAVFDSGGDADPLLDEASRRGLAIGAVFITHTHGDHVFEIDRIASRTGAAVFAPENEPWQGARTFKPGQRFQVGKLEIETRPTPGHSPGGTTYVISGLARPVAIVGDALFAGSIGGVRHGYAGALAAIREQILSLPDHTLLVPGHGPATTAGFERANNPFFAS